MSESPDQSGERPANAALRHATHLLKSAVGK